MAISPNGLPVAFIMAVSISSRTSASPTETGRGTLPRASTSACAVDQRAPAQLAEQLLEIRQRDLLTLADFGERHRAAATLHRKIDHRRHCKPPFSRQPHRTLLLIIKHLYHFPQYMINFVKYRIPDRFSQQSCSDSSRRTGRAGRPRRSPLPGVGVAPESGQSADRYSRCD